MIVLPPGYEMLAIVQFNHDATAENIIVGRIVAVAVPDPWSDLVEGSYYVVGWGWLSDAGPPIGTGHTAWIREIHGRDTIGDALVTIAARFPGDMSGCEGWYDESRVVQDE